MAPIHRQFIPEPQSRAASQRKQLPDSPYGSLCVSQRALHHCQDVAECLEVCRLWMGGHRRLQNGVIPYEPSRRFHEISLLPFPQEQYNENMMGTTFGNFFEKAICSILANLENIIISEPLWVIFDCLCLFIMQVLFFLSDRMNDNIQISLFCHNKYEKP